MIYTIQETSNTSDVEKVFTHPTSGLGDAFGRLRFSSPRTLFDSKTLGDSRALFWNDVAASGTGTNSTFDSNSNTTFLSVGETTAGKRVRQTYQRWNYQPGKSQLIMLTFVLGANTAGITREVGYFDNNNGLFLRQTEEGLSFVVRSNVTGTPVDTVIPQSSWNINKLHGLDVTKSQILWIDFESLMVGSVRFGFVINGKLHYCHLQAHSNILDAPYFSSPNQPIRYSIENDGTGAASTLECICSTVISEGGEDETGILRSISSGATPLAASVSGTVYAFAGIRLKATHLDNVVRLKSFSMLATSNDDFEWRILLNPTVAGTFTYGDLANSAVQYVLGATANTVSGGTLLDSGYSASASAVIKTQETIRYIGAAYDGTRDQLVLAVRPLGNTATILGSMTFQETS